MLENLPGVCSSTDLLLHMLGWLQICVEDGSCLRIYLGCAVVLICCCTCCVGNFRFVLKMPENLPVDAASPLLCAGITVYSPMRYFGMDVKGTNFGLVGLGGLGHMAVKFAKAFGMKVTVFSTSPHKEKEA